MGLPHLRPSLLGHQVRQRRPPTTHSGNLQVGSLLLQPRPGFPLERRPKLKHPLRMVECLEPRPLGLARMLRPILLHLELVLAHPRLRLLPTLAALVSMSVQVLEMDRARVRLHSQLAWASHLEDERFESCRRLERSRQQSNPPWPSLINTNRPQTPSFYSFSRLLAHCIYPASDLIIINHLLYP